MGLCAAHKRAYYSIVIHSFVAEAEGICAAREDRGVGDGVFEVEIRQRSQWNMEEEGEAEAVPAASH